MKQDNKALIFLSIFYHKDEWHLLLERLNNLNFNGESNPWGITNAWLFLNQERGSGIRLLVEVPAHKKRIVEKELTDTLQGIIAKNPSAANPMHLPISSFFMDFPNNEVRHNLFSEDLLSEYPFADIQSILSRLILVFFENHPVDDEGVFTFILYVQHYLIQGLLDGEESPELIISDIIYEFERKKSLRRTRNRIDLSTEIPEITMFDDGPEQVLILLTELKQLIGRLQEASDPKLPLYFYIIRILRKHVYAISEDVFMDTVALLQRIYKQNFALAPWSIE